MASMDGNTSKIIMAFVTLLLGVLLINVLASQTDDVTKLISLTDVNVSLASPPMWNGTGVNESQTYTLATLGSTDAGCQLTSVKFENETQVALTRNTDYVMNDATGVYSFKNTTVMHGIAKLDNRTLITYDYCPVGYLRQGFGRSAADIAIGLFAIALLGISVGLFYGVMKTWMDK